MKLAVLGLAMTVSGQFVPVAQAAKPAVADWELPPIQIVDEAGSPVSEAKAAMVRSDRSMIGFHFKKADSDGRIVFSHEDYFYPSVTKVPEGKYRVMVLARGMAPAFAEWAKQGRAPVSLLNCGRAHCS